MSKKTEPQRGDILWFLEDGRWKRAVYLGNIGMNLRIEVEGKPIWRTTQALVSAHCHHGDCPNPRICKEVGVGPNGDAHA